MAEATNRFGVLVRGGNVDEAPQVYRPLKPVLAAHAESVAGVRRLRPVGVVMAGADVRDPYKVLRQPRRVPLLGLHPVTRPP